MESSVIREIENYERTCELCQHIDEGEEAKKALFKLVPKISEIFFKDKLRHRWTLTRIGGGKLLFTQNYYYYEYFLPGFLKISQYDLGRVSQVS